MLTLILGIVAAILAFLDMVLWYATEYRANPRHLLLQLAVLIVCIAIILSAAGVTLGTH